MGLYTNMLTKAFCKLLENPNHLDVSIIGYVCKAFDITIASNINILYRNSIKTKYRKMILGYLG